MHIRFYAYIHRDEMSDEEQKGARGGREGLQATLVNYPGGVCNR